MPVCVHLGSKWQSEDLNPRGLAPSPNHQCALGVRVAACARCPPPLGLCPGTPCVTGGAQPEIEHGHSPLLGPSPPLLLSEPWSRSAGQHPAFLPLLPAWNAAQSFSAYRRPCGAPARPGAAGVCGGHWQGGRLPGSRSGILVRAELDVVLAAQATGEPCFTPACRAIWAPGEPSAGHPAGTGNFIGGQSASFWGPHLDCFPSVLW